MLNIGESISIAVTEIKNTLQIGAKYFIVEISSKLKALKFNLCYFFKEFYIEISKNEWKPLTSDNFYYTIYNKILLATIDSIES